MLNIVLPQYRLNQKKLLNHLRDVRGKVIGQLAFLTDLRKVCEGEIYILAGDIPLLRVVHQKKKQHRQRRSTALIKCMYSV